MACTDTLLLMSIDAFILTGISIQDSRKETKAAIPRAALNESAFDEGASQGQSLMDALAKVTYLDYTVQTVFSP